MMNLIPLTDILMFEAGMVLFGQNGATKAHCDEWLEPGM